MTQQLPGNLKRSTTTWWITGVAAVLVVLVLIIISTSAPEPLPTGPLPPLPADGTTLGNPNAPITVEEYGDFQCPACGAFARGTLKQIEAKYVKNGTVKIVFHYFAVLGDESIRAAEAAECANEQGQFWPYYDQLFNHQAGENQGTFSDERLASFAQALQLDRGQFNTCLKNDRYRDKVFADVNEGRSRGVDHVPTLFVRDQKSVGAISMAQFEAILAPYLAK